MMQCYDTVTPCEAPATPPLRRSRRSSWPPLVSPDIGCEARGLALVTPGGRHRIQSDSVSEVGPALHQHHVSQRKLLQMTLIAYHVTCDIVTHIRWWELTPGPQETENSVVTNASVDRKRRIASIFQHYYPEGGWGLVLLLVVLLVQVILHGLLLSYGVLLPKVVRRFRVSVVESGQDHLVSITHIKYLHAQLLGHRPI